MKTIKPFIDLGWHTVPLRGELKRLEDGSKTQPKFEKNWREVYQEKFNDLATPLGGTMTGEVSNIIAIDCDNTETYKLFRSLDPDYQVVFMSKGKLDKEGKEKTCGTFIYLYDADFGDNFSINDDSMALDFYSNSGFVYLPTTANETKVAWSDDDFSNLELKPVPAAVSVLLKQLEKASAPPKREAPTTNLNIMTANCLAPTVKDFNDKRKLAPGLFKIITPKSFRDLPQYAEHGYLDPADIPTGRGSEYLSKVSAILGADISVDADMYYEAMTNINNLFTEPMSMDRINATIIDPMLDGKANIDGEPIWKYVDNWDQHRLVLSTKRQTTMELGYDDNRLAYFCVDAANERFKSFDRDGELMAYIDATAISPPKKTEIKRSVPIINVRSEPSMPFGFNEGDDPTARMLNVFKQTPELAIINDPESYASSYKRPDTTIKYLETLMPDPVMREYVIKFMRKKLTTFKYSPVVLYFLGVHGSGKDLFVKIFEHMIGSVVRPTVKEFLEIYNGWLLDAYIVQLDEYGNQLTKVTDREEALGKLKAYTGKPTVQIRQMRTDGFMYEHRALFIMTANKNPLIGEDGDRRLALIDTPNVFAAADWIVNAGGGPKVHDQVMAETKDFAYYLATEVPNMSDAEYMKPPESETKHKMLADSMYPAQKLAYAFKHGMKDYIKELAEDHASNQMVMALQHGRVEIDAMEELYSSLTDHKGEMRSLNKIFRAAGINLVPTTSGGMKTYYYDVPWLAEQEHTWDMEPD